MREADGGGVDDSVFTPPPGSPGAIRAAAGNLRASGGRASGLASSARSARAETTGWSGTAADRFGGFADRVERLGSRAAEPIGHTAATIEGYADDLDTAQRSIAAAKSRYDKANAAANAIRERVNANPNRTQAQVDAAEQEIAGHQSTAQAAVEDARKAWSSYNSAAQRAAGRLSAVAESEKGNADASWLEEQIGAAESTRTWNDRFHAAWDGSGLGAWLGHLTKLGTKGAAETERLLAELRQSRQGQQIVVDFVKSALAKGEDVAPAVLEEAQQAAKDLGGSKTLLENLEAGARSAKAFERFEGVLKGVDAAGIAGDALTIIDPEDSGAMGWVDRGAAGVNGALLAANMTMDEIPGVGEAVMIGTGAYLAGDYLYHHWQPFHDACDYVGGHVADYAVDAGHAVADVASDTAHAVSDAADKTVDAVGDAASSIAHGIGNLF